MIKQNPESLQPQGLLSATAHEGESIYIPAKQRKTISAHTSTWKVALSKQVNCSRIQSRGRAEHYCQRTECFIWKEANPKDAGQHRERPNMWHLLTHGLMDGLLKNAFRGQRLITSSEPEKCNKNFSVFI